MKSILAVLAVTVAASAAAVPASANTLGFTSKMPIRGIPVRPPNFGTFAGKTPVRIIGVVVRPNYPVRGLVIDRPVGGLKGPLIRGVPVERMF